MNTKEKGKVSMMKKAPAKKPRPLPKRNSRSNKNAENRL